MKKRKLHCSHVFHMVQCTCGHLHYVHADVEGMDLEAGHCTIRPCKCESFMARPGYRPEQLVHDTVPLEGYDYKGPPLGKVRVIQK